MGSLYHPPSAPKRTEQNSNFCFFRHSLLLTLTYKQSLSQISEDKLCQNYLKTILTITFAALQCYSPASAAATTASLDPIAAGNTAQEFSATVEIPATASAAAAAVESVLQSSKEKIDK